MEAAVVPELVKLGILGIACVVEAYVIVRLYNRVEHLQDKRVDDTARLVTLMESMRDTADRQAGALNSLADLIRAKGGGQ